MLYESGDGRGRGMSVEGLARWRAPLAVHDPGKFLTDLVVVRLPSGS